MKYNFNINQFAAVQLGDIDIVDVCIIDWLRDICVSESSKIASKRYKDHTWVSYSHAISDMPLLGMNSKEAFRKRLIKLVEKGYFSILSNDQKVYVKPSTRVDSLYFNRQPQLTVPSTPVDGSKDTLTGVNRQPQLTNPNPNTKSLGNSDLKINKNSTSSATSPASKEDHRGEYSPAKEALRKRIEEMRKKLDSV